MARSPRSPVTKARRSGTAQTGSASRARAASKSSIAPARQRATAKRGSASKRRARKAARAGQSWPAALETLVSSSQGRNILAEVLEAAAGALRKGQGELQENVATGARAMRDVSGAAIDAGTEVVKGTAGLAQTATEVLADVVTSAARSLLPESGEGGTSRRTRKRKSSGEGNR
jgi:hypothetical protein